MTVSATVTEATFKYRAPSDPATISLLASPLISTADSVPPPSVTSTAPALTATDVLYSLVGSASASSTLSVRALPSSILMLPGLLSVAIVWSSVPTKLVVVPSSSV